MRLKALLTIILSLCAVSTYAQFKASIQGTVQDSKGGVVAGAKVRVTNESTGAIRETTTSDQGFYRVNELAPGTYTVTVEASGFKHTISKNIVVDAEQQRGYDVILDIGRASCRE